METQHVPVLLAEAVESLQCKADGIYLDATLGSGGHALKILKENPEIKGLIALDCDEDAIKRAESRLAPFSHKTFLFRDNFINIKKILKQVGVKEVDGILIDLGVSSQQLEDGSRGFSFNLRGPLDMRMDRSQTMTAFDIVNRTPAPQLEQILRDYGEERYAARITRTLVNERKKEAIADTLKLSRLVTRSIPRSRRHRRIHPATKSFQALRIAVNHELDNLSAVIEEGITLLAPQGRFCLISFHSLEDRIIKHTLRKRAKKSTPSKDTQGNDREQPGTLRIITKKPIVPQPEEMKANPRARSAKLRVAEKV
jgi:16S rRNA (cytosine1402-N4)-methyltransferase